MVSQLMLRKISVNQSMPPFSSARREKLVFGLWQVCRNPYFLCPRLLFYVTGVG